MVKRILTMMLVFSMVVGIMPTPKTNAATIKLNKKSLTLYIYSSDLTDSETLKIKGTKSKVKWSSSRKKVASVNKKGKVTARKVGTTVITAKVKGKKYKCKVTVKKYIQKSDSTPSPSTTNTNTNTTSNTSVTPAPVKMTAITGMPFSLTLDLWTSHGLSYSIVPSNTTNKKLSWTSSNTSVATVSDKGIIFAKWPGFATITASSCDGSNVNRSVYVSVVDETIVPLEGVYFDVDTVTIYDDEETTLNLLPMPATAEIVSVDMSSSDTSIATVNNKGNVLPKTTGSVIITAKAKGIQKDGSWGSAVEAQCKVNIIPRVTLTVPDVPLQILEYIGSRLYTACNITEIKYEIKKESSWSSRYTVDITIKGTKTYDKDGDFHSRGCSIGWKLYNDSNVVKKSGSWSTVSLCTGEAFEETHTIYIDIDEPGDYKLSLLNIG